MPLCGGQFLAKHASFSFERLDPVLKSVAHCFESCGMFTQSALLPLDTIKLPLDTINLCP